MVINLIVMLILIMVAFLMYNYEQKYNTNYKTPFIVFATIVLVLQSGMRNIAVGSDTYAYSWRYENDLNYSWTDIYGFLHDYYVLGVGKDPGYHVFEKLTQLLFVNYQLYLCLIAALFFYPLGILINKYSNSIADALFAFLLYSALFFSFFSITGHRQTVATAAALYSLKYIEKRKFFHFIIIILLASSIHKSCLVFIPFYFITYLNEVWTKRLFICVFISLPVLFLTKNIIFQYLSDFNLYAQYDYYQGAGTYTFTFMFMLIIMIALWRLKLIFVQSHKATIAFQALSIAMLFLPLTWINPSAMRIVQYYSIFLLLLMPAIINTFEFESQNIKKLVYMFAVIVLIGLMIKANYRIEYKFFWQDMKLGKNY